MISEELLLSAVRESVKKVMESLEAPADPDQSERLKQDSVSSKIDDLGARKRENEKFEVDEEKEEDPEIDLTGDKKDKEEKEDEKFSYDVPDTFPKHVKFQDIVDQLNYVRSGASAKDDDVKTGLMKYFDNLKDDEKRDLLAMLSGFATIMNKLEIWKMLQPPQNSAMELKRVKNQKKNHLKFLLTSLE